MDEKYTAEIDEAKTVSPVEVERLPEVDLGLHFGA